MVSESRSSAKESALRVCAHSPAMRIVLLKSTQICNSDIAHTRSLREGERREMILCSPKEMTSGLLFRHTPRVKDEKRL